MCHPALNISHDPQCNELPPVSDINRPENRIGQTMVSVSSSIDSDNEPAPGIGSFCSSVMTIEGSDPASLQADGCALIMSKLRTRHKNCLRFHNRLNHDCFLLVCVDEGDLNKRPFFLTG